MTTNINTNTTIKVATVQLPHCNYNVSKNIQRGVDAIEEAAAQGAQLVLLPEFFSSGYLFHTELWEMAEVLDGGPTLTALQQAADRLRVVIGFTVLEACEQDFYNTFVLVEPFQARKNCRKSQAAGFEAWVFREDDSFSPVLKSSTLEGLKVGVSICYENMLASQQQRLQEAAPMDILLCPHSAPTTDVCLSFPADQQELMNGILCFTPHRMAKLWQVPVVFSNKVGSIQSRNPIPWFMIPNHHTFRGFSSIVAADGTVVAKTTNYEASSNDPPKTEVAVTQVSLSKSDHTSQQTISDAKGRYVVTLPFPLPFVWTYLMEPMGRWNYSYWSRAKRIAAVKRAIARGPEPSTYQPGESKTNAQVKVAVLVAVGALTMTFWNNKDGK